MLEVMETEQEPGADHVWATGQIYFLSSFRLSPTHLCRLCPATVTSLCGHALHLMIPQPL